LIATPLSIKHDKGERDLEKHPTKIGNQWNIGMKAHVGVDAEPGLARTLTVKATNPHDVMQAQAKDSWTAVESVPAAWAKARKQVSRSQKRAELAKTQGWFHPYEKLRINSRFGGGHASRLQLI